MVNKTKLHTACENNDIEKVKALLNQRVNIEEKTNAKTPLQYVCENGKLEIAKLLIEKGANREAINKWKKTPLHYACENGHLELVQLLIEKGAVKESKDKRNETPFHIACKKGHLQIVKFLADTGADLKSENKDSRTPLHDACEKGHLDVVKLLIKEGANKEAKENSNKTPLHFACMNGHLEVAELLIEKGANKKATDHEMETPLHKASSFGHFSVVKLLVENGANLEAYDGDNQTPLHIACLNGHHRCVEVLLKAGANIDAVTKTNQTPLDLAKQKKSKECILLLEKKTFLPEGIKKELTSLVDKYKNNHPLMGKAIIINIEKYVGDVLPKRSGSGEDVNELTKLFSKLNIKKVDQPALDWKYMEILDQTENFLKEFKDGDASMSIFVMMAHGGYDGELFTANGKSIKIESIIDQFDDRLCPNLKGKPKWFIFQACRGDMGNFPNFHRDRMISTETDQSMQSQIKDKPVGTKRDVLISYATIPGEVVLRRMTKSQFVELAFDQIDDLLNDIFAKNLSNHLRSYVSNRSPQDGSWFIQSLCRVFNEYADQAHLEDLLKITSKELGKKFDDDTGSQTCVTELRGFDKHLFFNCKKD